MQKTSISLGILIASILISNSASAQTLNPAARIYQFTGVYHSDSTGNVGTGTVFTCTNFSNTAATLRFVMRSDTGVVVADVSVNLSAKSSYSYSTKSTQAHFETSLNVQGTYLNASMAIASTEREVRCSGKVTPADATAPQGYVLPAARFFQVTGSAE